MNRVLILLLVGGSATLAQADVPVGGKFVGAVLSRSAAPVALRVLNTGLTISDREYNSDYAMPQFGDVAVLKIQDAVEPPQIVWASLFDGSWQLPE